MSHLSIKQKKIVPIKRNKINAIFKTQMSFDSAISQLLIHGYSATEIIVKTQEEDSEKHYIIAGIAEDSDAAFIQKAVRGLKLGAVAGSFSLGMAIVYLILFDGDMLQAGPVTSILFGLLAGATGGGILGLLIKSLLPFKHLKNYNLMLSKGQTLLSFQPKNERDERFFKSLNWPTYAIAS